MTGFATSDIVVKKLYRVRDTILKVNLQYIESAAQEDACRTEPPFKLQGSYRNMNRIAEKVLPLMTDEEVDALVLDHYENESQTLTTGAEANLLKFREMLDILAPEEKERWEDIRKTFQRNLLTGGDGDTDPVSRVVGQLAGFGAGLEKIEKALRDAREQYAAARVAEKPVEKEEAKVAPDYPVKLADATIKQLENIIAGLRAVPVDVQIDVLPVEQSQAAGKPELPVQVDSKVGQFVETEDSTDK